MLNRLFFTTILLAGIAAASPLAITFSGIGNGSVGAQAFMSAAFTFTFTSDTSAVVVPSCCATDFSTPAGTPATFSIAGIGSGTLTSDQAVFANTNPAVLTVGMWHFEMPDVLDLSRLAFANYDLSTSIGPIFVDAPFAFSNGFSTTLGDFVLDSATNVTYAATVSTTEVPEPSSLALFISGLAACVAVYVIRGVKGVR